MSASNGLPEASLLKLFGGLLVRPGAGVHAVLDSAPALGAVVRALAAVGLLRGAAEGLWYYLMTGRGDQVVNLLAEPSWYTRYGGPYLSVLPRLDGPEDSPC